jgi:sugar lactone lactonase YvrE/predicted Ser/Thr protein kinase
VSTSADPSVGSELLGYRLEELLGRGGMGVVFRARDQRLERNVALKLLVPELASDRRFRERFLRESVLLASLDHPNVIPIYDAGEADGRLFIAMRYVEGGDLGDLLRAGPLEPEATLALCSQVAEALDAAHERGLVHRDVKPSNVLLDAREHVYLADFGLTRHIAGGDAPTMETRSLGTIDYIAPEQIRGEDVDGRADLYSLGCLLYECLTGAPPFRRPSDLAVAFAHLEEEPPAPPELVALMQKALAKAPEDRYQSGRELVDAARTALGLDAPQRRRWPLLVAAVVIVLVVAGSLSILLTRGESSGATGAALTGRLLRIDPRSNQVTHTVDVGPGPNAVAFGDKHVWVSTFGDGNVWRIDPNTFRRSSFSAQGGPLGVAVSNGVVYVPESQTVACLRADGTFIGHHQTNAYYGGPITNSGSVWFVGELANYGKAFRLSAPSLTCDAISRGRIPDPSPLNEVHTRFDFVGVANGARGARGVWAAGDALDRRVLRIDPGTGRFEAAVPLPFAPGGIAVGRGAVWVTAQLGDFVARINPATNKVVQKIGVGRGSEPTSIAVGGGSVWVANTLDRSITRINLTSNDQVRIPLKVSPKSLTFAAGSVWVAADAR